MKISETAKGMTEEYVVKFWYKNDEGYFRQSEKSFYCNSKAAHKQIEKYAQKVLTKEYKEYRMIAITYQ